LPWELFVVPAAVLLWYVTLYQSFDTIKKIFLVMSLAFLTYLVTGFLAHPAWGQVLSSTVVPRAGFGFASISSAVALLGATISPFTIFWQVRGEKEEPRPGTKRQQIRTAALDICSGVLGGNLVAYFIILTTAATLYVHHTGITTAADAARALEPLAGPFARYLFAIGLIGSGLVAIPILLASTSYAVTGTFGWAASLWSKPWQNEGFYLTLTAALAVSMLIALLGFSPIKLLFYANIMQAVLAPLLVILILLVGNNRAIMQDFRLRWSTNTGLVLTALLLIAACALFFYNLATGQGG
jgi:Mn2+/Fe2+ NRAMP family transporter